jgi:hypothetical protein
MTPMISIYQSSWTDGIHPSVTGSFDRQGKVSRRVMPRETFP